jgi:hypothetical protein
MNISRREFVATGLAGAAGLCASGCVTGGNTPVPQSQLQDEGRNKVWLRYAPPRDAAKG